MSTTEQHVEPQLHALHAYAEARGFEVVESYIDHGVSGARDRRPGLDQLLADCPSMVERGEVVGDDELPAGHSPASLSDPISAAPALPPQATPGGTPINPKAAAAEG